MPRILGFAIPYYGSRGTADLGQRRDRRHRSLLEKLEGRVALSTSATDLTGLAKMASAAVVSAQPVTTPSPAITLTLLQNEPFQYISGPGILVAYNVAGNLQHGVINFYWATGPSYKDAIGPSPAYTLTNAEDYGQVVAVHR